MSVKRQAFFGRWPQALAWKGLPAENYELFSFGTVVLQYMTEENGMAYDLDKRLVIGVSTRTLFDLSCENRIFERQGLEAYRKY